MTKKKAAKARVAKKPKTAPTVPFSAQLDALDLPATVSLAAMLARELRACELRSDLIGNVSCRAAARHVARQGGSFVGNRDHLASAVLGYLLVEAERPLSELRVMLVEAAVDRAYKAWSV